jgi:hypothetical protein
MENKYYPLCYKVENGCPPCNPSLSSIIYKSKYPNCLEQLIKLSITADVKEKNSLEEDLFKCLKQYGDVYKQLDIELYVNPINKKILFPTEERIISNLKKYIRECINNRTEINEDLLLLYNMILISPLKEKYDEYYYSIGDISSLLPKEYGIARLINRGGKKSKRRIQRKSKRQIQRKSKRRIQRKSKRQIQRKK